MARVIYINKYGKWHLATENIHRAYLWIDKAQEQQDQPTAHELVDLRSAFVVLWDRVVRLSGNDTFIMLHNSKVPRETCPRCNDPFEPFMRGIVQSFWRKLFRRPHVAVICRCCKEIVGWERPYEFELRKKP